MLIKKRLAVSNVLMLLVPVVITMLISLACIGSIWFTITHGTGVGFDDSEDFYQASISITELVEGSLKFDQQDKQIQSLETLSRFLDRNSMSLMVTADGLEFYRYGISSDEAEDSRLINAALALDNNGTVSSGNRYLYVHSQSYGETEYVIYLFNTQSQRSYASLKVTVVIAGGILILAILFSVFFTDRFLIRFVFKHIEEPLDILSNGVRQISDGNLDYRLKYEENDEFFPVCQDFNGMADRLRDSVERSRREEESRKELMAGISHDLRSPLASIQAYVEGLLDGVATTPEAQKKYLITIKNKSEELERMVSRILAYSRLAMESATHDDVTFQLDEYLASELSIIAADYADRGLDICYELEPFAVTADTSELYQLLVNIADNSRKYKIKERGMLRVTLENNGEKCLLSFKDDGPGVPVESLPKLFDIFYRADLSRTDRTKGSGLGLSIVEKTVTRLGGTIWAENSPEGGLVINIELPKGERADDKNIDC